MAASNLACFWKCCKCATCRAVCSKCQSAIPFDPTDECGITKCEKWEPLTWEQYQEGLGWTGPAYSVTEMDFLKALHGITGPEFDTLYQEGVIRPKGNGFEFDQMVLFARFRELRGKRPSSVKLKYLTDSMGKIAFAHLDEYPPASSYYQDLLQRRKERIIESRKAHKEDT